MLFKEYYNKLTEMPHSNRAHYDYDIEYFKPKDNEDKLKKFEELKQYIVKLTSKNGDKVLSPINGYEFISDQHKGRMAHKDFLMDQLRIIPTFLMNNFGDLISKDIIPKAMPITKRTKKEIESYQRWVNNLIGQNISEFYENKNINNIE